MCSKASDLFVADHEPALVPQVPDRHSCTMMLPSSLLVAVCEVAETHRDGPQMSPQQHSQWLKRPNKETYDKTLRHSVLCSSLLLTSFCSNIRLFDIRVIYRRQRGTTSFSEIVAHDEIESPTRTCLTKKNTPEAWPCSEKKKMR